MRRILALIALASCLPRSAPTSAVAERGRPACGDPDEEDARLVVDWSPLDRSKLESAVRRGDVLVRFDGCRARIADGCTAARPYGFSATSRQREIMLLRDAGELAVRLPFLASRFGASVSRSSALDVTMTVVGRYEAGPTRLSSSEVEGECTGVTHMVSSVSVGAFAKAPPEEPNANAAADLLVTGRAAYATERRHLDSAGIEERCSVARRDDALPPEDCAIPLRVELRRLTASPLAPRPAATADPSASDSDGEMSRAMETAKKQLVPCHRSARATAPGLSGILTLGVKLGRRGNVRSVSAKQEGDLGNELAACAAERIALRSAAHAASSLPSRPRTTTDRGRSSSRCSSAPSPSRYDGDHSFLIVISTNELGAIGAPTW